MFEMFNVIKYISIIHNDLGISNLLLAVSVLYNVSKNNISLRKVLRCQQMVDDPATHDINYTASFDGINNLWVTCRAAYRR